MSEILSRIHYIIVRKLVKCSSTRIKLMIKHVENPQDVKNEL